MVCFGFAQGEKLLGVVDRVTPDGVWVSITCILKGRVFILDMSDSAKDIRNLSGSCPAPSPGHERVSLHLGSLTL